MNNSLAYPQTTEAIFDIDAYLERIQYTGPLEATSATLLGIHRAQALHIPFENLDIHLGAGIHIDDATVIAKLVGRKRGGYCYEVNGLLHMALRYLGFTVTNLVARNLTGGLPHSQKSHRIMLVEIAGEQWIADVGFGGNGLVDPIRLVLDAPQTQLNDTYRIIAQHPHMYVLQMLIQAEWQPLYAFTLEEYYVSDYRMMNYFNSTSPDSKFVKQRMCVIPKIGSRLILTGMDLKIRRPDTTETRHITSESEYLEVLTNDFGIVLPPDARFKELPQ